MGTMMIPSLESSVGIRVIMHGFFTCTIQLGWCWGEPGVVLDSHQARLPMCVRPGGLQDNISPSSVSRDPGGKLQGKEAPLPILLPSHSPSLDTHQWKSWKTSNTWFCIHQFVRPYCESFYFLSSHASRVWQLGGDLILTEDSRSSLLQPLLGALLCLVHVFGNAWCWPAFIQLFNCLLYHLASPSFQCPPSLHYIFLLSWAIPSNLINQTFMSLST